MSGGMTASAIPRFDLYEEAVEAAREPDFLHIETIFARSHLRSWTIRPHRHDILLQMLVATAGGGTLTVDGQNIAFEAPWIVALPPTIVHGFAFREDTEGFVLTTSEDFFLSSCLPEAHLAAAFGAPLMISLPSRGPGTATTRGILAAFDGLVREFSNAAPRRREALASWLKLLVVQVDRARLENAAAGQLVHPQRKTRYLRFRQLVEKHWRTERSIRAYAGSLGMSASGLNAACKRASGSTAAQVIRQRVIAEAKRQLTYTTMSVSEIAYDLGFSEPAYFTRVFRRITGEAPSLYRARRTQR